MARRLFALVSLLLAACSRDREKEAPPSSRQPAAKPSVTAAPRVLYLPDADVPGTAASALEATDGVRLVPVVVSRCPPDMVDVRGEFCIDRYEASLVDARESRKLSPFYHPRPKQTRTAFVRWEKERLRIGSTSARSMPIPSPPEWQLEEPFEPKAVSERGVLPSGYLSREVAELACKNAGKRLCSGAEWVTACRGHQQRKYPYGSEYKYGACNVHRDTHPASVLHDDASIGHLDPRLNQVEARDGPLLRVTGDTPTCRSEWGADAVYDMVGNLDEWIDDVDGTFVGGFYARATTEGCDARIESHAPEYYDYSLGVRCCLTPGSALPAR